jgi:tetratricopeptide (TPR) repeat protein
MRSYRFTLALVAMVLGLAGSSAGRSDGAAPQAQMSAMSVAELERAGDEARAAKDYEQAMAYFQAAIRKDKKNPYLLNKLGLAQLKASKLAEARSSFEKAVKRDSKYADGFNNLGAVYFVQRNLGAATRNFKKAVALNETKSVYHINLGAAWFGQNKLDRAMAEYGRALQLDPEALNRNSSAGISAQITTTEERARYDYMMAKIYARMGNAEECLRCLKKAKEGGYHNLSNVYKEEEFSRLWQDPRLAEIAPPPAK